MLVKRLRKEWHAREGAGGIHETLCLLPEGLVLGAGTVLAPAGAVRDGEADDDRLKALLSVAYARPVEGPAVRHIKAAAVRWNEGDQARAELHLALSRLAGLARPNEAARRLFMVDGLIRAGIAPRAILEALDFEAPTGDAMAKYSPNQPRVPAGSGRTSGEWTSGDSGNQASGGGGNGNPIAEHSGNQTAPTASIRPAASTPIASPGGVEAVGRPGLTLLNFSFPAADAGRFGPALDLGALSAATLSRLAPFIAGLGESSALAGAVTAGGAVLALGVLFIPSTGPKGQWIEVGGRGDVSYYVNPDEAVLRLKYTTPDNVPHVIAVSPGPGGDYRGPDGRVIARLVKAGAKTGLIVSTAALVGTDSDEPQVCPAATKDRGGELGADYEDFAKALFNPGNPTPRKMAYDFLNPKTGEYVKIDDCQQQSGALAEYKGPNFEEHYLKNDIPWKGMLSDMLKQSENQIAAKGNRSLTWFFEEKSVADKIRTLFETEGTERVGIDVEWLPWPGKPAGKRK